MTTTFRLFVAISTLVVGTALAADGPRTPPQSQLPAPAPNGSATSGVVRTDAATSAGQEAIRQADLGMAKAVAEHDLPRFLSFIADDATFFGGQAIAKGRDAVSKQWEALVAETRGRFTWKPLKAEVSGDLGYTIGVWESSSPDEQGILKTARGSYVTMWRRHADGGWRAVVDIGSKLVYER